jgi:hypothetical protein
VVAGGGSGDRGVREKGQQRGETGPGQGESDVWRPPKQEVGRQRQHSGSGEVLCTGGSEEQGSRGVPEEEEIGGRVSRDLVAKYRNPRDLIVKQNSPLIQNSNEEVTKIKVVEFFKSYNIALGFKFRNPKYTALILSFEQKLYLSKFCPY